MVYHYTDAAGLVGILSTHTVWATEYRFLNDTSEVEYTRGLVQSLLTERMKGAPSGVASALYSNILARLDDRQEDTEIYIFSLSENGDSLSQWRGYAQDGRGFAVGFDLKAILDAAEQDSASAACTRVEYNRELQERGLDLALRDIEAYCESALKKNGAVKEKILQNGAGAFDQIVWNRSMINKHASFESEQEWRLFSFFRK